jgi:hypothetical protein
VHIKDRFGTFAKAAEITPTLARAQWCFRATGSKRIISLLEECDGDSLK